MTTTKKPRRKSDWQKYQGYVRQVLEQGGEVCRHTLEAIPGADPKVIARFHK